MDRIGEGEGGTNWEIRTDVDTLPCVKQLIESCCIGSSAPCSVMT